MPCPMKVNIPMAFRYWNNWSMYGKDDRYLNYYKNNVKEEGSPINCIECGKCEKLCPQHIQIRKNLKEVISDFKM